MLLEKVISQLKDVRGPDSHGWYSARCPYHLIGAGPTWASRGMTSHASYRPVACVIYHDLSESNSQGRSLDIKQRR